MVKRLSRPNQNNKITSGHRSILPENGLHQGSMISPLLFNIYAEPIVEALQSKLKIPLEDILFYADDLAVICSYNKAERVISTVENLSFELNLIINKKMCGILPIKNKRISFRDLEGDLQGVPFVDSYRYLGIEMDQKISIDKFAERIVRKTNYILYRTSGFLQNANPETRRFMWSALVRPLYDYCFPILEDMTKRTREEILRNLRKSFKKALELRQTTSQDIMDALIGDLDTYIQTRANIAKEKIRERFGGNRKAVTGLGTRLYPNLHLIPRVYLTILNMLNTSTCKICKEERVTWHHLSKHGWVMRNPSAVLEYKGKQWEEMKKLKGEKQEEAKKRLFEEKEVWTRNLMSQYTLMFDLLSVPGPVPLK